MLTVVVLRCLAGVPDGVHDITSLGGVPDEVPVKLYSLQGGSLFSRSFFSYSFFGSRWGLLCLGPGDWFGGGL